MTESDKPKAPEDERTEEGDTEGHYAMHQFQGNGVNPAQEQDTEKDGSDDAPGVFR